MMKHDEADLEALLEGWRAGGAVRRDLYSAVRADMRQFARRGIGFITSDRPDDQDVEEVVYRAFCELEAQDPAEVRSIRGLSRQIAYRRGQDMGRAVIRRREQIRGLTQDRGIRATIEFTDDDVRDAAERDRLTSYAEECLEALPGDQQEVVQATVMGHETLSDWALRAGKSHQAASKQRERALRSLRRCVTTKQAARQNSEGGNR